jgi:hypothetical protein
MQIDEQITSETDDGAADSRSVLFQALFAGVVFGTASNIAALCVGHSIWVGLICHSLFGMLGMGLVLGLHLLKRDKPTNSRPQKTAASQVSTL